MRTALLSLVVLAGIVLASSTVSGSPQTTRDALPELPPLVPTMPERPSYPPETVHLEETPDVQQPGHEAEVPPIADVMHVDIDIIVQPDDGAHEPETVPEPDGRTSKDRSWPATTLHTILGLVLLVEAY